MRPTAAHTRAVVAGAAFLLLGALFGRLDAVLIAVPLVAWLAVAYRVRPRVQEAATLRVSDTRLMESDAVHVEASSPAEGALVTAAAPLSDALTYAPTWGMLTDAGSAQLTVRPNTWGRFPLGPIVVQVSDALGAFRRADTHPALTLAVVPNAGSAPSAPALRKVLGVSGPHLSRATGDGTALADVRAFRPGDRLTRINWRVTSRTRTLHTNDTFTERDTDVLIVTDTLSDIHPVGAVPGGVGSSLDQTVQAVTGLSRHFLSLGDRVALCDLGTRIGSVGFRSGQGQLARIVELLAHTSRDSLSPVRLARLPRVRAGTLTYVCSPLLRGDVLEKIGTLVASGAHVSVIDTLPPSLVDASRLTGAPLRRIEGAEDRRLWDEAWVLRGIERRVQFSALERRGVPVTRWEDAP